MRPGTAQRFALGHRSCSSSRSIPPLVGSASNVARGATDARGVREILCGFARFHAKPHGSLRLRAIPLRAVIRGKGAMHLGGRKSVRRRGIAPRARFSVPTSPRSAQDVEDGDLPLGRCWGPAGTLRVLPPQPPYCSCTASPGPGRPGRSTGLSRVSLRLLCPEGLSMSGALHLLRPDRPKTGPSTGGGSKNAALQDDSGRVSPPVPGSSTIALHSASAIAPLRWGCAP